jgi:hypothetical protein
LEESAEGGTHGVYQANQRMLKRINGHVDHSASARRSAPGGESTGKIGNFPCPYC